MCHGQGRVGIAALGVISQPQTKPVAWSLFLDISGDGPSAIAAQRGQTVPNQTLEIAPGGLQRSLGENRRLSACVECVGYNYFFGGINRKQEKTESPLAGGIIFVLPSLRGSKVRGNTDSRRGTFLMGRKQM